MIYFYSKNQPSFTYFILFYLLIYRIVRSLVLYRLLYLVQQPSILSFLSLNPNRFRFTMIAMTILGQFSLFLHQHLLKTTVVNLLCVVYSTCSVKIATRLGSIRVYTNNKVVKEFVADGIVGLYLRFLQIETVKNKAIFLLSELFFE